MTFSRRLFIRNVGMASSLGLLPFQVIAGNDQQSNHDCNRLPGEAEALLAAVKSGNSKTVKEILAKSPGLLYLKDEMDRSLSWVASMNGQMKLLPELQPAQYIADLFDHCAAGNSKGISDYVKKYPLSLNNPNRSGYTSLLVASECGQGASVETLVGIGANIEDRLPTTLEENSLILALQHADTDAVSWMTQILLGNGANPNAGLKDSTMPIHLAASAGQEFAVKMLLRKQANADAKDGKGKTAIDLAKTNRHDGIAKLIAEYPASQKDYYITRHNNKAAQKIEHDDTYGLPISLINDYVVAGHFNLDRAKQLLHQIPDLLHTRASWDEMAIEGCTHVGNEPLVNFLLEQGAPYSILTASMLGDASSVSRMIKENPQVITDRGPHDFPIIWYAAIGRSKRDIAEILLANGADVNANVRGRSVLSECASRGHAELAEYLIQQGADVNMISKSVFLTGTPLEIAIQRKRDNVIAVFRKYGAK